MEVYFDSPMSRGNGGVVYFESFWELGGVGVQLRMILDMVVGVYLSCMYSSNIRTITLGFG